MLSGAKGEWPHRLGPRGRIRRALRFEWLGQTLASLSWIASVFTYGLSETGDWLQLLAAFAWLLANVAALAAPEDSVPSS